MKGVTLTRTWRTFAAVATVLLVAIVYLPGQAEAQASCTDVTCVAQALKQSPVYVDPTAQSHISSAQANQLSSQSLGGNPPVYIAILPDKAAASVGGYDNLPSAVGMALGVPGVVGVVAGTHFRAGASSGIGFAAGEAGGLATQALQSNNPGKLNGNVVPMLSNFISRVHSAPRTQPAASRSTSSNAAPKTHSSAGKVLLWVLLGLALVVVVVIIIACVSSASRRKRDREARNKSLKADIEQLGSDLTDMDDTVKLNALAKSEHNKAFGQFQRAENSFNVGDFDSARQALSSGLRHKRNAEDALNPVSNEPARRSSRSTRGNGGQSVRSTGSSGASAQVTGPPPGVVINNTNYAPQQAASVGYPHYYGGGYYNGAWFGPGYYQDPFWEWVMMDELLEDREDRDDRDNDGQASSNGGDWNGSGQTSSDGDWPTPAGGDSGGGDWGSTPTPDPDPVSTGGGGDYGGGTDSSGGWDSGGGSDFSSGDFGGGGGDSGGGSW